MSERMVATTLRLSVPVWQGLRRLAELEAIKHGGRPSTTAAVSRLIIEALQNQGIFISTGEES